MLRYNSYGFSLRAKYVQQSTFRVKGSLHLILWVRYIVGHKKCRKDFFSHRTRCSDDHFTLNKDEDVGVPRRASQVSALDVARLRLNNGAKLCISFKHYFKTKQIITQIVEIQYKGLDVPHCCVFISRILYQLLGIPL